MGSPDPKTICVDLDGTLCTNTFGDYETAEPLRWAIERVNALASAGHEIVIFTARGTATGIDWEQVTRAQLERWGVAYDALRFGKPSADVYVDDRAVHTDAWRAGDAFRAPGFADAADAFPAAAPPHLTTIVEVGRTFAGEALLLDEHAAHAAACARAVGIADAPDVAEHVRRALGGEDEIVFSISLSAPGHAAFLDVPGSLVSVTRRPLQVAATALAPLLADGFAVRAATDGRPGAWPLRVDPRGHVSDALGGELALVADGAVVLDAAARTVAGSWLERTLDIQIARRRLRADELRTAEEAFVVGMPFCVVPIAAVDGEPTARGEASTRLLDGLSAAAGIDIAEQTLALARVAEPEPV
jgi:hypothetical protein